MGKLKRLGALAVVFTIIVQAMFITAANAHWHDLGANQENHWGDEFNTQSKGTLTVSDIKFNIESDDSLAQYMSAFNKFTFDKEDSDTLIVTSISSYFPRVIGTSKELHAYKFYNPKDNKKNFDIYFWAGFDADLKALVQKGDIRIKTVASTKTYDQGDDNDSGYVNMISYNSNNSELFRRSVGTRNNGFHKDQSTGWVTLDKSTNYITEYIESRGGRDGGDNNSAYVQNVRVYLKDAVRPKVKKVEIVSTHDETTTNAGKKKQRAKVGDTITYNVTFDEKVNIYGKPQLVLNAKNNYNGLRANFIGITDSQTAKFEYIVKDMTDQPENSLDALAGVKGLVLNSASIKDKAGNNIATNSNSIGSYVDLSSVFSNNKVTVDDTYTKIHDTNYIDTQNGYFYPKKTSYYSGVLSTQKYTTGSMPSELEEPPASSGSGDVYNQPIMIGTNPDTVGAIFRVVLNEEINKIALGTHIDPVRLKLQVYDKNKNPLNKYVTAPLIASRIMNVSSSVPSQGINTGQTELLFRYKPLVTEFINQGLIDEVYYLDFAGAFNGNDFVFAQDIFSKQLKNISNMPVSPLRLILPAANSVKRTPLNQIVMIDLKGPVLTANNLETEFKTKLKDSTTLTFTEDYAIDTVEISLVAYMGTRKLAVHSKLPGTASGSSIVTYAKYDTEAKNYSVDLSGFTTSGDLPLNEAGSDNAQIYLEYVAKDMAGNITTNRDVKDMPVKIDTTAPSVDGVSVLIDKVDRNTAHVQYEVSDRGIGEVEDEFFYKIEEGVSRNTPAGSSKTATSESQDLSFTGEEGTKKTYQVWVNFSDTLGNKMPDYYPSGPVDIATRTFSLRLSDTAKSKVIGNHNITVYADKIPLNDYTMKLYYKWVPTGMTDSAVSYKTVLYTPESFNEGATTVNLSSDTLQNEWMRDLTGEEKLFNGEMRLVGYAEMLTMQNGEEVVESTQHYIGGTYYFDITGPVINMSISGANAGYNSLYNVKLDLTDDGGEYMSGIYTANGNIGYNSGDPKVAGNAPSFEVLVGSETIPIDGYEAIDSASYELDLDFMKRYKNRSGYVNPTEAYLRVTATDLSGNTTIHTFGFGTDPEGKLMPIKFDVVDPVIQSMIPLYHDGKTENRDYAKYANTIDENESEGSENLYLVRSISDAVKGIQTTVSDNVADKMYARFYQGLNHARTYFSEMVAGRSFTIDTPTYSSFEKTSFRGYPSYTFNMYTEDMSGNSTSENISFIEDTNAPEIALVYGLGNEGLTNERITNVHVIYSSDSYETNEDITVAVSGEGSSVSNITAINHAIIDVTQNGTITINLTDRLGNSTSKTVEVSTFDYVLPETMVLSNDNATSSPAKYGEIAFMTVDDRLLNDLKVAIVPQGTTPAVEDYFYSKADSEYFEVVNEITSVSLDMTGESISIPIGFQDAKKYKLSYLCIPDGTYDVYTRNTDFAGNINESILATIYCSSQPPQVTDITYTPTTMTGGDVTVEVTTDTPTYIGELAYTNKNYSEAGSNVAIMQEAITKAREEGFSYVWEGQLKQLSVTDAVYKYYDIYNRLYDVTNPLSAEEKYLFKNISVDTYDNFLNYAVIDNYPEPIGDMVDFLVNKAFIHRDYETFTDSQITAKPYILMNMNHFDGISDIFNFNNEIVDPLMNASANSLISTSLLSEFAITYTHNTERQWEGPGFILDIYSYPTAFDTFDVETQGKTVIVDENGDPILDAEGNLTYSYYFTDKSLGYTNEQILTAIKKLQEARKKVITTVADKYVKHFCDVDRNEYASKHTLTYDYRINETMHMVDRSGQATAFDISVQNIYTDLPHIVEDSIKLYQDISGVREEIKSDVNTESSNLVIDNTAITGTRFDNYYIFDIKDANGNILTPLGSGATSTVAASVYSESIKDTVTGSVYSIGRIMLIDGTLLDGNVALKEEDIIPAENAPSQVIALGTQLYKYTDVLLTDNGIISFRIIDPTMLTGDSKNLAVGEQYYKVDIFDREKPHAYISFTPQGNVDNMVNTPVTVSVINARDNKSKSSGITVINDKGGSNSHTFTENGTVTFTVADAANNQTQYAVTVDYINKNPVTLTAKFYLSDGTEITDKFGFTEDLDLATSPATKTTKYSYNGEYTNQPINIVIYSDGKEYTQFNINDNTAYKNELDETVDAVKLSYVNSAGTTGFINIGLNKFDRQPPKLATPVTYQKGIFNEIKQVKAYFTLLDDKTTVFDKEKLASVFITQRKDNEVTTILSKDAVTYEGSNSFSLLFEYNGEAKLEFQDEAGNTLDVDILVDTLDKKAPYVIKELRTSESKTNKDVTVMLYPNEDVRYKVTTQDGKTDLKPWSIVLNMNPAVFAFTENSIVTVWLEDKEGNTSYKNIAIDYIDKIKPELDFEIIYNKALTTANVQELLDIERLSNNSATIYDLQNKLIIDYVGAATIKLYVKNLALKDIFTGGMKEPNGKILDTIAISNRDNAVYHTVMANGTYSFTYTDAAGNVNTLFVPVARIDSTPPKANVSCNPTTWVRGAAQITINPYDINLDGSEKTDGKAYVVIKAVKKDSYTFTAETNAEYQFTVVDDSGNSRTVDVNITRLDNTPPTISYGGSFKDLFYKLGSFTADEKARYEGDIIISDEESGVKTSTKSITYSRYNAAKKAYDKVQSIDPNLPAIYNVTITADDIAGNEAELTRKIKILGDADIIPTLNNVELIPNSQFNFNQGTLELKVFNVEDTGDKVIYCFEKGYYNEAQMKGSSYKKAMAAGSTAPLVADTPGMYTLLIQTEDRQSFIAYVFITGAID